MEIYHIIFHSKFNGPQPIWTVHLLDIFLLNIDKDAFGNVFIGNDRNHGCHFSMMRFDADNNTLWYVDSLGWDIPNNL